MIRWAKLLEGEDPFSTRDLVTWPQAGLRASTLLMLVGFRFIVSAMILFLESLKQNHGPGLEVESHCRLTSENDFT